MGFDGRAAGRTELSSRNLTGPNVNAYSSAPGWVPKSLTPPTSAKHGRQPSTKVPVASRTANAAAPVSRSGISLSPIWSGLGSGALKPSGSLTGCNATAEPMSRSARSIVVCCMQSSVLYAAAAAWVYAAAAARSDAQRWTAMLYHS